MARVELTFEEVSIIQDALYFHPLTDDNNVLSDEDRWERDQLRKATAKIDRAYDRLGGA
jgi:hypothetical protein